MSASEKLKALYESAYEGANGRTLDDKPLLRNWQRPHSEELIALANALPQIVAVVEAAENVPMWPAAGTKSSRVALAQALAALDEALS
jgi:hypothetical protein